MNTEWEILPTAQVLTRWANALLATENNEVYVYAFNNGLDIMIDYIYTPAGRTAIRMRAVPKAEPPNA